MWKEKGKGLKGPRYSNKNSLIFACNPNPGPCSPVNPLILHLGRQLLRNPSSTPTSGHNLSSKILSPLIFGTQLLRNPAPPPSGPACRGSSYHILSAPKQRSATSLQQRIIPPLLHILVVCRIIRKTMNNLYL